MTLYVQNLRYLVRLLCGLNKCKVLEQCLAYNEHYINNCYYYYYYFYLIIMIFCKARVTDF